MGYIGGCPYRREITLALPPPEKGQTMILEHYYIECRSHASYLIGDETTGRAVVVDPRRDITEYLEDAAKYGLTIEGVTNTHFHADFVSGHLELGGLQRLEGQPRSGLRP